MLFGNYPISEEKTTGSCSFFKRNYSIIYKLQYFFFKNMNAQIFYTIKTYLVNSIIYKQIGIFCG